MSDYRHVKPADEFGRIMDPEDGEFLPPKGKVVKWSPYWERLKLRGDEIVHRAAADPTEAEKDEPDAAEAEPDGDKRSRRRAGWAAKPTEPGDAPAEVESSGKPERATDQPA